MNEIIRFLYSFKFNVFGIELNSEDLVGTINSLTDFNKIQTMSIWKLGELISECIIPIALSILVLFFMINMIKKAMETERISWERIAMSFVLFFIIKFLIENGYTFLTSIMNVTNEIFLSISNAITNGNTTINIADTLINAVPTGFIDSIMTYALYLILFIPFVTTLIQIFTQVFLRVIKLILAFAFAPIPLALSVDDENRSKTMQYLMFIISIGLEAVVIYVATNIYCVGLSGMSTTVSDTNAISTVISILFLNGMYLAILQYASQFTERLTGGGH